MSHSDHPGDAVPVGFWSRTLATLADSVMEYVYIAVLLGIAGVAPTAVSASPNPAAFAIISYILPVIVTLLFWSRWQATPGKMMIGARIVDARTGADATIGQLAGRYFAYFVSLLPLGLGFLWVAWDPRKQGWHDKLAGTMVVRASSPTVALHEAPRRQAGAEGPAFAPGGAAVTRPAAQGPWANPAAAAGHASLVWIRGGFLHMAEVAEPDLPGAAAAAVRGEMPGLAVPLGSLHSATGEEGDGELLVRYGDAAGQLQEAIASFRTAEFRDEVLHSLHARLGSGWSRVVEQESRWAGVWQIVCAIFVIGTATLWLQFIANSMGPGNIPDVPGETNKQKILMAAAYVIADLLGSRAVGVIGGVLIALCVVAIPFVAASPTRHVILRRTGWVPDTIAMPAGAAY
jgi:uncharacterized RDD family membrane protein YckC